MRTCLNLFGRPDVEHAGRVGALRAERRFQLLAYLALRRGWVGRAELGALLWPEHSAPLALTNVRKALHFARALPWAATLESEGGAVRFEPPTDLVEFERAAREGRVADALRLCRGEVLDGFEDLANPAWTEWLGAERARLAQARHALTRARLGQLEGAPHERVALARQLLDADPLDEDAVVALLAAQGALGQTSEQAETYRSYAARLDEELGVAPSSRVRLLIGDGGARVVEAGPTGLGDGFVGRAREIDELIEWLARSDCAIVTVTGPGGVGKSHLIKHALRRLAPRFAGGALWIALDDLSEIPQVVARIVSELGLKPDPAQDALELVCAQPALRETLLVLDNAEHLYGLPRLVARLVTAAPGARVCVTSRARLNVPGERLLPLRGLALPDAHAPGERILESEAARLFVTAAKANRPDFDAAAQSREIGALVRALDGLPLALLLAANWARLWSVGAIERELARSLDVLESAEEGEERPEHRSARATFEQSWRLLTKPEQVALQALSVFLGTFTLTAAREVALAPLPLLAALADQSLLQIHEDGRCALHPLIRQFVDEKLGEPARGEATRRHAEWFHRRLAHLDRDYAGGDERALDEIDRELENFRAAWRQAIADRATHTLAASALPLLRFFEVRGRAADGVKLLQEAQRVAIDARSPACAANVLSAIAHLLYRLYRTDEAVATARQALGYARAARNRSAMFRCLNALGLCHWQWGRHREAKRILEQSLRQAEAANERTSAVIALGNLAVVEKALGNYERAGELMLDVLARQRELGDWVGVATRLNNLAHLHQSRGEWSLARRCLAEGLEVADAHGIAFVRPHLLVNLAHVAFFAHEFDEAERVGHETLAEARASANRHVEATVLLLLVRVAVRRRAYDAARMHLRGAIACTGAMGNVPMQLDCVFCHAELLAADGDVRTAKSLMRYYIDRAEVEPGDRQIAQAALDALAADPPGGPPPAVPLDVLLRTIAADT